jgi:hypothetical protein
VQIAVAVNGKADEIKPVAFLVADGSVAERNMLHKQIVMTETQEEEVLLKEFCGDWINEEGALLDHQQTKAIIDPYFGDVCRARKHKWRCPIGCTQVKSKKPYCKQDQCANFKDIGIAPCRVHDRLPPTTQNEVEMRLQQLDGIIATSRAIVAKHEVVIIQLVYVGSVELTKNWICMARKFGGVLEKTLFIATDEGSEEALKRFPELVNVVHYPCKSSPAMQYGEVAYFRYMLCQTDLIAKVVSADVTVWLVEASAVWNRDPTPLVLSQGGDVVAMNTQMSPLKEIEGGFQLLRPTPNTKSIWNGLSKAQSSNLAKYAGCQMFREIQDEESEHAMMEAIIKQTPMLKISWLEGPDFYGGMWYTMSAHAQTGKKDTSVNKNPTVILNNVIAGNQGKIHQAKTFSQWFLGSSGNCNSPARGSSGTTNFSNTLTLPPPPTLPPGPQKEVAVATSEYLYPSKTTYVCQDEIAIEGEADIRLSNGQVFGSEFTQAECVAECDLNPTCHSYVFGEAQQYCELWSKTEPSKAWPGVALCTKLGTSTSADAATRAAETASYTPERQLEFPVPNYICQNDTAIEGQADILLQNGSPFGTGFTKGTCAGQCQLNPACQHFLYIDKKAYCELWSTSAPTSTWLGSVLCTKPGAPPFASVSTGPAFAAQSSPAEVVVRNPASYRCQSGIAIEGEADIRLSNGQVFGSGFTQAGCVAECDLNPTCHSYVFGEAQQYCELWSKTEPTKAWPGVALCTKLGTPTKLL